MKIKDLSDEELDKRIRELDDLIHGEFPCYNTKDIINLDNLLVERENRESSVDEE